MLSLHHDDQRMQSTSTVLSHNNRVALQAIVAVRQRQAVAVHATSKEERGGPLANGGSCVAAAAALGHSELLSAGAAPAKAAARGPWSFYNMTKYQVELLLTYANPDGAKCPSNPGGPNPVVLSPGLGFTLSSTHGSCIIRSIHATAFVQDTPGGKPRIVDEEGWAVSAPNSQGASEWVVLQLQNSSKIQLLHVRD